MSESNADDYTWSSSLDTMGPSGGSDSCIPEEDEADIEHKKTVRFNDVISQKIYRYDKFEVNYWLIQKIVSVYQENEWRLHLLINFLVAQNCRIALCKSSHICY